MQRILLLEDNQFDAELVATEIKKHWPDIEMEIVSRLSEANALLHSEILFDCAIFDLNLPDGNGMDLLTELREEQIEIPIIILTGLGSEEIAISALKAGANDYIPKKTGFHKLIPEQIKFTVNKALQNRQNLSILYVEHHQSDVDLTLLHLKKHAPYIHLTKVSTGEEALNILPEDNSKECQFDVILLDYRLPGLNALEICKIILQERKLSAALVIVTGQGDEKIAVEALKLGVDDYIVKNENYLLRLPSVITSAFRRKELERQKNTIQQSETKFRLLADYAADWEYWINPEGEYIYISPACLQTSGYPPEAFEKNKYLLNEITTPKYRKMVTQHFLEEVKDPHKAIEFTITTPDGKEKWISHICRAVYDSNNNYLGKRGINRDITDRKKAELELYQSEERFKRLFEDLGDAVFVTKIGGNNMGEIMEVNSAAEKQTGYSKRELMHMNIIGDLYVFGTGEYITEQWDDALREGKTVTAIEKKRKKDGTEYWTEVIVTPIEYKGEPASLSINHDITDRKRGELIQEVILNISNATQLADNLEETLQIIQKELGKLMDTSNFFVALYNEETDRINLLYYRDEKDEVAEFPMGNTLTGLVIKQGQSLLVDSATAKKLEEENKIDKVGFDSEIWLGIPLKTKGKISGAFVVQSYSDPKAYTEKDKEVLEIISNQISISIERKQEEEKLLEALEAAKESDRIKIAFLANMSHELRTPLNAVIGFSSLIDERTDPRDSASFAQLILKSGNNLLAIVDDIFEITLLDQNNINVKQIKRPLVDFLSEIYQTILNRQINMGNTHVVIEKEITGINPLSNLFTDFDKLKKVFLCILGNALKYTNQGYIRFGVYPSENEKNFVFFVKDTGIGIPKEKHQIIFERFKIGDDTLTRKHSGIGVGLYISKKLVNLLGGEIWVESEEGNGSCFYFSIPR